MPSKKDPKTYAELLAELQSVIEWFQNSEVSVDEASAKYKAGMQLISELETRLAAAEGEIVMLAKQTD